MQKLKADKFDINLHIIYFHTFDELKLSCNCLKLSHPIIFFDGAFDSKIFFEKSQCAKKKQISIKLTHLKIITLALVIAPMFAEAL